MTPQELETKLADLSKDLEKATVKAAEAETASKAAIERAEKAEQTLRKVLTLNAEEQEVYKSLEGEAQSTFLTATVEERAAFVAKAKEPTPVPEPIAKELRELRKTLDAQKQVNDELTAQVSKAKEATRFEILKKSADAEYGALPGTVEEKATALKALDKLSDEERESVTKLLAAGNAASIEITKQIGRDAPSTDDSVEAVIEKKARVYAAENKVSFEKAYTTVLEQDAALYKRYLESRKSVPTQ